MPKRVPLATWTHRRYEVLKPSDIGPERYALKLMSMATRPYRRKEGRDPLSSYQRMHVARWEYERVDGRRSNTNSAPQIVESYQALLREWYGEKPED